MADQIPEIRCMGEFFDLLLKTEDGQGRIFLEDWDNELIPKDRRKFRGKPFNHKWVEILCAYVSSMMSDRLRGICTDGLYNLISRQGHAFLEEIGRVAAEHGVDFGALGTDRNVTIAEMAESQGVIRVVDGKVTPNM